MVIRRLVLAAFVGLLTCSTASAVVKGFPTSAFVQATSGTVGLNDSGITVPPETHTLANALTPGTVEKFTLSGAASVVIEFRWDSAQDLHRGATGVNFAVYLGNAANNAVNSGGSANFNIAQIDYSEDDFSTTSASASPGTTLDASGGALPHQAVYYSINASASGQDAVTAVRLTFSQTSGTTSFFLAAVQNPEPATWALFAVGLGGLGLVARRRAVRRRGARPARSSL